MLEIVLQVHTLVLKADTSAKLDR